MKPITPQEVGAAKANSIPSEVIEIFNGLIAKNWDGKRSRFKTKDVIHAIEDRFMVKFESMKSSGWLDVEEVYRTAGWNVYYDKPGYCENYEPTYEFSLK